MEYTQLSDAEVSLELAKALKEWRVEPTGAGLTQEELARRSGAALTSLKRFEKTGSITLRNFIALLRALGLVDRLETLIPAPDAPGPLELLEHERRAAAAARERAPRFRRGS